MFNSKYIITFLSNNNITELKKYLMGKSINTRETVRQNSKISVEIDSGIEIIKLIIFLKSKKNSIINVIYYKDNKIIYIIKNNSESDNSSNNSFSSGIMYDYTSDEY